MLQWWGQDSKGKTETKTERVTFKTEIKSKTVEILSGGRILQLLQWWTKNITEWTPTLTWHQQVHNKSKRTASCTTNSRQIEVSSIYLCVPDGGLVVIAGLDDTSQLDVRPDLELIHRLHLKTLHVARYVRTVHRLKVPHLYSQHMPQCDDSAGMCSMATTSRPRPDPESVRWIGLKLGLVLGLCSGFKLGLVFGHCLLILVMLQQPVLRGFTSIGKTAICLVSEGQGRSEAFVFKVSSRSRTVLMDTFHLIQVRLHPADSTLTVG